MILEIAIKSIFFYENGFCFQFLTFKSHRRRKSYYRVWPEYISSEYIFYYYYINFQDKTILIHDTQ